MSNIRGLYDDKDDSDDDKDRDSNNRYVGGIGAQGGGSGLAVEPNFSDGPGGPSSSSDSIFNLAERSGPDDTSGAAAGANSSNSNDAPVRRTITMYRDGFVVDDGPYRRLDDTANAQFLQSLARGQTPSELRGDDSGNITVGLVDKRKEEYVETFRSFSGAGQSLAAASSEGGASDGATDDGIFDPSSLPAVEDAVEDASTSIAVRMLDGKRKVIKIALTATVEQLAAHAVQASNTTISDRFRIVSGFPPKPLKDGTQSIEEAGLKGAQVQLQKVA